MRQIKFRGKRKDNGLWVYGYYFEAPLTHETGECASYLCGDRRFLISQNGVTFDVLPETVGQYSTVKDEDGMEIYEGDIIELVNESGELITATCRFGVARRPLFGKLEVDIPSFYFELKNGYKSFPIVKNYAGKHDLELFKVIGNKWEKESK